MPRKFLTSLLRLGGGWFAIHKQALSVFCLLILCYAYVHQRPGWNQNSRLDVLHAIFVHGTLRIDAYHENTGDKSIHDGHYYSDKAPGITFLALPAFALSAGALHLLDVPLDSPEGWLASDWITTVGSVAVITALGGAAFFVFLARMVGQRIAYITTLVVFLGASPFPYATALFSHASVIGLVCIALWAIADEHFVSRTIMGNFPMFSERQNKRNNKQILPLASPGGRGWNEEAKSGRHQQLIPIKFDLSQGWIKRYVLAGLCCGLAVSSEFTAATAAGGILILAVCASVRRGLILALAAIPPLLLIPAYNWACFGDPLSFGYHHLALTGFHGMNNGLFGITFPPKVSAAYLILLSPERGLFFWTPFFLLAFFGLILIYKGSPKLFWISVIILTLHVTAISGYYMPSGGRALGPRHLAPMLPFLAIAAAFGLCHRPFLGCVLGYYSIMLTGLGTMIEATPPLETRILDFYLGMLLSSDLNDTIASCLGLPRYFSLCLIFAVLISAYICACLRKEVTSGSRVNNLAQTLDNPTSH